MWAKILQQLQHIRMFPGENVIFIAARDGIA